MPILQRTLLHIKQRLGLSSKECKTMAIQGEERDAQLDKLKVLMQDCCQNESVYTATNATFSEIQNEIQKRKSKQTRRTRNEDNESMEEDKEENDKPINIRQVCMMM
ncbi:hypothetical protein C0J52_06987 [Blattella germanica]|nr:hypothetical protein C0J52_06987 [Blattella germanica]